jgi:hypothetical protein
MRIVCCGLALALGCGIGGAAERAILLKDLPAPVQATVKAETAGAAVKGISRETGHGMTLYEVETIVNGMSRDILIDQSGAVVEVEQQIALSAAPPHVQQSLSHIGQVLKLERTTARGVTTFEAHVQQGSKKRSVTVDANGQALAPK